MLGFSLFPENVMKMDFDAIVMDATLHESFGYDIPKEKVLLDRMGKPKKAFKSKVAVPSKQKTPGMAPEKKGTEKERAGKEDGSNIEGGCFNSIFQSCSCGLEGFYFHPRLGW